MNKIMKKIWKYWTSKKNFSLDILSIIMIALIVILAVVSNSHFESGEILRGIITTTITTALTVLVMVRMFTCHRDIY